MQTTLEDFDKRKKEIEHYFKFLELLQHDELRLHYIQASNIDLVTRVFHINDELIKIIKANGFLLLYNMLEATIRNALQEILYAAESDNLLIETVSLKLKKLWIDYTLNKIRKGNKNTWSKEILDIIEDVIQKQNLTFDKEIINISGNIDVREIVKLADSFGFRTIESGSRGSNIKKIKDNRNSLAHGNRSFADCGKDYTISELLQMKVDTLSYLNDVVENIEDFIINKQYAL